MEPIDPVDYEDRVVKPHRSGTAPEEQAGLFTRYALTGDLTDGEILDRINEVRALWRQTGAAVTTPRTLKRVYERFLAEDAELRTSHGDAVDSADWWRARGDQDEPAAPDALASLLATAYQPLQTVTPRLVAALHRAFPERSPREVDRAIAAAGLCVAASPGVPVRDETVAALAAGLPVAILFERLVSEGAGHEQAASTVLTALDRRASAEPPVTVAAADPEQLTAPPRDLDAQTRGLSVVLAWEPGEDHPRGTRYSVVRHPEHAPDHGSGTELGETTGTELSDPDAPVGPAVHYAVFAKAPGRDRWSAPARTAVPVFPSVELHESRRTGNTLQLTWRVRPEAVLLRIRRSQGGTERDIEFDTAGREGRVHYSDEEVGDLDTTDVAYQVQPVYQLAGGTRAGEPFRCSARGLAVSDAPVEVGLEPAPPGFGPRVTARWHPPAVGQVRVHFAAVKPNWQPGDRIPVASVEDYGEELRGRPEPDGDRVRLTGDVAPGWQWYLPVTVLGSECTVGRPAQLGTALPVSQVEAQRRGGELVLSWVWPPGLADVRVSWTGSDGERSTDVSAYAYQTNGCRIRVGPGRVQVEVRGMVTSSAGTAFSAPETLGVAGHAPRVDYTVRRNRWRRREATIAFHAMDAVHDSEVVVVGSAGEAPPGSPVDGVELARHRLDLKPGGAGQLAVDLPEGPDWRWLACFPASPGTLKLTTSLSNHLEVRR